jgi:tRNA dimethylallyltransferase
MKKVLAIVGPTAVGKTSLSIDIAKKFNGEIISGDSMQVYQKLDIGTAKVTDTEMQGVPHHLIDVKTIHDRFSASDFKAEATRLINEISQRNKLPIIVGGTGFYLQALLQDLELGGNKEDRAQVESIRKNLNQKTDEELLALLQKIDLDTFKTIDQNNRRRVIRAIEVYQVSGRKISEQQEQAHPYDDLLIGLNTDRPILYERINQRVEMMLDDGLEREARWLFEQDQVPQANKGIGYREWQGYFEKTRSLADTVELIQKDSRHYAKRQLTWFRNKMDVNWFDIIQNADEQAKIYQKIESWLDDNNELER